MNLATLNLYTRRRTVLKARTRIISQLYPLPFVNICFINKSRIFNLFANVIRAAMKYVGSGSNSSNSTPHITHTHTLTQNTHTRAHVATALYAHHSSRSSAL